MTLTKDVLVKIIKEELAALTAEAEETEVDPVDAQIADLEQQLAEAKKMKAGKGTKKGLGAKPHPSHKMSPLKAKAKK
jgi:hypothetical protein